MLRSCRGDCMARQAGGCKEAWGKSIRSEEENGFESRLHFTLTTGLEGCVTLFWSFFTLVSNMGIDSHTLRGYFKDSPGEGLKFLPFPCRLEIDGSKLTILPGWAAGSWQTLTSTPSCWKWPCPVSCSSIDFGKKSIEGCWVSVCVRGPASRLERM